MARSLTLALLALALAAPPAMAQTAWRATGALETGRASHTATLLRDGTVLAAGGLVRGGPGQGFPPTTSSEVYDPRTGAWSAAGAMGVARSGHTAPRLEGPACAGGAPPSWCGKVLVAGGAPSGAAELYDPAARSFAATGALATPRTGHTATVLPDGRVLVVGGRLVAANGQLGDPQATAEIYDPASGLWAATPTAPAEPRSNHTATVLPGGRVLLAGGVGVGLVTVAAAEVYDPFTGSWSSAGSLVVPRSQHTANLLSDGRVLLVGGEDTFGAVRRTVEAFSPAAGQWSVAGTLVRGRARHTATVRPDGSVIVAGGHGVGPTGSATDFADSELFRGGAWMNTGPLLGARQRHTATLLQGPACGANCGRVLVTGGIRPTVPSVLASSELLFPATPAYPLPSSGRVSDLSARALSARRVRLSFSAPGWPPRSGRPATRYLVKQARRALTAASFERARSLCGGNCTFAPGRIGDRITLTVTGLVPNRRYHYGLLALDSAGNRGPVSNYASVRTRRDRIRPGRVRRSSARALSSRRVRLRFRAPASDGRRGPPVRRYVIKQSAAPIRGARRFRRARSLCRSTCRFEPRRVGSRLTLTVRNLCPGRRYHYAIRAKDEGGNLGRVTRFRSVRTKGGTPRTRCGGR